MLDRARLELLAEGSSFDKTWIKGVRKWWKQWSSQAHSYSGRVSEMRALRHRTGMEVLEAARDAALAHLNRGLGMVRRLRADLTINKGFWHEFDKKRDKELVRSWRAKVVTQLDEAESLLNDSVDHVEFWGSGGHAAGPGVGRDHTAEVMQELESLNRNLSAVSAVAGSGTLNSDKAISGKLLRQLSKLVNMSSEPVDFGGYDPDVVNVGKVTAIFTNASGHPRQRSKALRSMKEAQLRLKAAGLGRLWYGKFRFQPKIHGKGKVKYGGKSGQAGATYHRLGDFVQFYGFDDASVHTILHELGHRYYYKFLSNRKRHDFDRHFGEVPATSAYGSTDASDLFDWKGVEDFAEVFADYLMGKIRRKDQRLRLKTFFGRKRRLESVESQR